MNYTFNDVINTTKIIINPTILDKCNIINNFFIENYINMFVAVIIYCLLTIIRFLFIKTNNSPLIDIPQFSIFKSEKIDLFLWSRDICLYYIFIKIISIAMLILVG